MPYWFKTSAGVGRWSIVYGVFLGLFWGLVLLWILPEVARIKSAEHILMVLLFGAVPVALITTGFRLRTAAGGTGTRVARLITVVLLACKSGMSCYWAATLFQDTGFLSRVNHLVGLLILVCVALPSAVWAVILVRTAIRKG